MELERAREIMKAMFAWCMYDIGVEGKAPERIPEEITLRDMLDANDVIKAEAKRLLEEARDGKKGVSIPMSIDPRGIAALYTAMHFRPDHDNTVASHGDAVVMVLSRTRLLETADTENDE